MRRSVLLGLSLLFLETLSAQAGEPFRYPEAKHGKGELRHVNGLPVLFVQGTRDSLCALPELESVRKRMTARSELFVVDSGDHSLEATKTALKQRATTQAEVELAIQAAVRAFGDSL